jgi:16S rRNA (adenine1518-N6/adenine1519-N6)-dimethyltransferase
LSNRAKALGVQARKSLGQNFLTDDGTSRRIVDAAGIAPGDLLIEIGPGLGALTRHLSDQTGPTGRVIAIELDQTLIPLLKDELGPRDNIEILHADALEVDYASLCAGRPVRVVANLPYYLTSHALRVLLESGIDWRTFVLTVQLEVAQRAVARPPEMSLLAVSVQYYGLPELLFKLPPSVFYPQPGVDSATLRISRDPHIPLATDAQQTRFFRWVRAGFAQPRKQLRNTLTTKLGITKGVTEDILEKSGITPDRRPETLTVSEWLRLAEIGENRLAS